MQTALRDFFANATPAGRCLVGIALSWPFFLWNWIGYAGVHHLPGDWSGFDSGINLVLLRLTEAGLLVNGLLALWLWPRRHAPEPCFGAQLLCALTVALLFTAYQIAFGVFTTGLSMITVGLLGVGLLLFERRVVLIGFVLVTALLVLADLLVLSGRLPYAPLLTPAALPGGEPVWWWQTWRNELFYASFAAWCGIIFWLLRRLDTQAEDLERLARRDVLTGLANRRHFMERLEAETRRRHRYGRAFSVVLCDIDRFKQVNDGYGHLAGDEVLRHIGRLLDQGLRTPADVAARLSGEEFALLLPETNRAQAEVVCERIRQQLREHEFACNGPDDPRRRFRVTLSMGVVECLYSLGEEALRQAEANLLAAQRGGRDRVVSTVDSDSDAAVEVPA
jgi:diguanylate cyclase (GGDEF)-like protein